MAPVEAQRPKTAAPAKGIHTREVCETGFQPRAADLALPVPKQEGPQAGSALAPNLPLDGVTVVELSWGMGLSAAACSHQLMAAGASVVKVVDSTKGDPWKTKGDPRVYEQVTVVNPQTKVYTRLKQTRTLHGPLMVLFTRSNGSNSPHQTPHQIHCAWTVQCGQGGLRSRRVLGSQPRPALAPPLDPAADHDR